MEARVHHTEWRYEIICLALGLLFAYTGISKVYDWHGTKMGLNNQVFPDWMATALLYGLPPVELITAVMLISNPFRKTGLSVSIILLSAFSIYIGIVMTGIFGRIPCSCGGVINSLGWGEHLVFNLAFLGMAVIGYLKG
ncbi:MauE/DoxX family redox-associated membrane protein [Arthrospiribacter ruber]|uniref:Methylamine utilisation protein MauE domain-containing protein n=1 Tax=Arthrospiribacter ruber TaxID=2487934 RepID=A0A951IV47_9BACT|nr:MauE/DoxX family redox-associated membrane protein [Arthrospiribacter ruber]MBW3466607.1 hypothetical protein [Arthrospiribacter ruber]